MRRRRLLGICAAFVLLALAGAAGAAPNPVKRSPSLLWKSYPLKQRTAASQPHLPLRPPALAVGTGSSSGGGFTISPYLVLLSIFGGLMLALTATLAKGRFKDAAPIATARKGRSVEPEPASTEEAKPDMLVALHPASVTAEEEPDLAESQPKTPFETRPAEIEDEGDVEPEQSDRAPSPLVRPLRILLVQLRSAEAGGSAAERPPLRALPHPLLRPIEDQLPEVGVPAEEEEPEAELPPPLEVASEPEPLWREASPDEDTEVVVESCQIRLWRGYFRYQLYVALGRSDINRAFALSPYFRLKDEDAPGAKAMAALRELLDELEAKGWTVTDEGRRWYAFILERPQ